MDEHNKTLPILTPEEKEKNKQYIMKDSCGQLHVFRAGEAGVTEEWIAFLKHDDNELRTSDFKYYYKWDGKTYVRMLLRSDDISPAELEHYSTMHDMAADVERLIIEKEEESASHAHYLAAMASLTKKQKELVHRMIVMGKSKVEIAREEGVAPSSIQSRWKCICKKFVKFFR